MLKNMNEDVSRWILLFRESVEEGVREAWVIAKVRARGVVQSGP